jgi:hypothetical protein
MEADLLVLMMAFTAADCWWYPQTLHYSSRSGAFSFFMRASRHRDFPKLAEIAGIGSADELRAAVRAGHKKLGVERSNDFWPTDQSFWSSMNMDALDTLT